LQDSKNDRVFRLLRAKKAVSVALAVTELAPVALTQEEEATLSAADIATLFRFGVIKEE
jgi:hypothetical protein